MLCGTTGTRRDFHHPPLLSQTRELTNQPTNKHLDNMLTALTSPFFFLAFHTFGARPSYQTVAGVVSVGTI
eukprot:scaffold1211_cov195-Alexandrium_tamarense.AAC.33